MVSRLIDGEYFKIDHMLSSDYETRVKLNKRDFMDNIDRAMILIRDSDRKPIIMNVEDSNVNMRVKSAFGSMNANGAGSQIRQGHHDCFQPEIFTGCAACHRR